MRKRFLSIVVVLVLLLSCIPTNIASAVTGDNVVTEARKWIGTKYGGSDGSAGPGPNNYVDCSGMVMQVYRALGIDLPRSTYNQDDCGTYIPYTQGNYSNLKPGDLLFMYNSGHVGIYAGNGKVIHASSDTYKKVVEVPIWSGGRDINTVRRIITGNEPHTHSWTYHNESAHPHREYRTCSCGEKQYTGKTKLVSTCSQCYPLGNVNLTRSFNRVSRSATFYRNNVTNANSYTLTLYKDGVSYGTYNMSSTEKTVSSLASGTYTATLTAKNTSTNQSKTANALSFTIVDTYDVIFDANGGTNAPSPQTKIKDEDLTLTSAEPKRAHYIFKGWAANKNETEPQYLSGDTYTKNTRITLYAVWEPETYTINFDTNGGKGEVESAAITYGNTMKMPNTIVRDGYYLKGWSKTKGATTPDYKLGLDHMLDSTMTLYAVWGQSTWGGTVATEFAGGDGTEENPYQISNAAELAHLADKVNNQQSEPEYEYYILTDNIDLGHKEWIPIGLYGNENQYFKGSFDGNGYTISDLSITDMNEQCIGLFGYVRDSSIQNITISSDIASIASEKIPHLVYVNFNGEDIHAGDCNIGALVALSVNTEINHCNTLYVNISDISLVEHLFGTYIGNICGCCFGGSITDCTSKEGYIGVKDGSYSLGAIVGYSKDGIISQCSVNSSEELFGTTTNTDGLWIGGVCGLSKSNIRQCSVKAAFLSGNIEGASRWCYVGGIVGNSDNSVELCNVEFYRGISKNISGQTFNTSMYITSTSNSFIGGIAGAADKGISNCKYNGETLAASATNNLFLGGILGIGGDINRSMTEVNGIIYGYADGNACVGGAVGTTGDPIDNSTINYNNIITVADKIESVHSSTYSDNYFAYSGDIWGRCEAKNINNENNYSYSSMEISSVNEKKQITLKLI